jgi:hypothetical protein
MAITKFRVRVTELRAYEMDIEAENEDEACDLARERFDLSENPVDDFSYDPDDIITTTLLYHYAPGEE